MIRLVALSITAAVVSGAAHAAVTFRDVAPILEAHCSGCHQPGEIGPMPLTSYKEARPWAAAIKQAVVRGTMPPWHADRATSELFANSRLLKESEVRTIAEWAESGAAEGTPGVAIDPPHATEGWKLGKPDLVIKVPGAKIPATGTYEYTFLVTPLDLPADTWVAAAEWKIDQRSLVHHMNAFLRPPGSSYLANVPPGKLYTPTHEERLARHKDEREVDRRELLVGYEPGYKPAPWGEGRAKLMHKGGAIVFEIHYNTNGKAATDYSELGIYFAKQPPRERVETITPADALGLKIPAGDPAHSTHVTATLTHDAKLVSLQPHMHLRGKAFDIWAVFPDGKREELLKVPRYDFNWQTTYFLKKPMDLPKGTMLEYTATFDNSPNNPSNPDPTKTVYWGDQSWDEMNIGFTELSFDVTADPDVAKLSGTTLPGSTWVNPKK
ncbi:MAG TPA: thiol-disulfide isomerase [Bryobacteraceae bacterium]